MAQATASNHPGGPQPTDKVRRLQRKLYGAAKQQKGRRFHALFGRIHRSDVLWRAWECVRSNRGAAGLDGVTLAVVEEHVLDADIRDYFGSIPHELLMERVKRRVSDRRVLKLLKSWLRAGVLSSGTPQGGVISPLLSNIYLHFLDTVWARQCAKMGVLVRYADDFVVLCREREAVKEAERRVRIIFERLKLKLHPEKTRKVELTDGKEGFDLLGCHLHKRMSGRLFEKTGNRSYYLNRWPSARSMKRVRARIRELTDRKWLGEKDVRAAIAPLNPVLRGWGNYFRTGKASHKFNQVDSYTHRRLRRFMVKRSGRNLRAGQANEWTPEWFWDHGLHRMLGTVRYPKPCTLPVKTPVKPYAGNPHVRFERRRVESGRA